MKKQLLMLSAAVVVVISPYQSRAEDAFPSKPITLLIGYAPGGGSDVSGRIIANRMSQTLHTRIIVENKVGAAGAIASQALARAQPDGYTIMLGTIAGLSVNQHLGMPMGYNPEKDFSFISLTVELPVVVMTNTETGLHTLADLDAALEKPNMLSYGSSGVGSAGHLAGELYKQMRHIKGFPHVAYKGGSLAMNDLLGNNVPILFSAISEVLPQLNSDRIKILAVTGLHRAPLLPQVKTLDESGMKGFSVTSWYGFVAPAGTPPAVINKLNQAVREALADKKVQGALEKIGMTTLPSTPEEMKAYVASESEKWGALIKSAHIQP